MDIKQEGVARFLQKHLAPGGVMIDVGANEGRFSLLAASIVGPEGRVLAFEPNPETAARLRSRAAAYPQVTVHEAAVTSKPGTTMLYLHTENPAEHSIAAANVVRRGGKIQVTTTTLDSLVDSIPRCDVIKIDAQGADARVLKGARRLLKRFHPRVIFELWPYGWSAFEDDPAETLASLERLGYQFWRVSRHGLKGRDHIDKFLAEPHQRFDSIDIAAMRANPPRKDRKPDFAR